MSQSPVPPAQYPIPQQPFPTAPKRSRTAFVVAIIAGVFAVLFLAGAIGAFALYSGEHDKVSDLQVKVSGLDTKISELTAVPDRRDTAQQAACHFMSLMGNYSYTDLDSYFTSVQNDSTDAWRKKFEDTGNTLREVMTSAQVRSTASDMHCGTTSLTADTAEVLVVYKQSITNTTNPQPTANIISMLISLRAQADGRWLADDVNVVAK
ncbi:hypothetical protein ACFVUS_14395 [Nocardia sp. NPDC058058]|uniref:hypothetical protein n=1 Tax=Nocardia sp. NPDC058058 TaxID=3346317 RepID=UPI0036DF54B0